VEVAAGYQITTRPEYNDWIRELVDPQKPTRLSIQALETLAVIAYKQPVTQPEIIELRGVKSGGVVKTLLEKRLIKITGRKEVVGRPILYATTKEFLLHFGLKDLADLPKIEEFAEVLGEEVDVAGLKKAIEAPRPVEVPLGEEDAGEADPVAAPMGGGYSTAGDLVRFADALTGNQLLSRPMTERVMNGYVPADYGGREGYGFETRVVNRIRILGHQGATAGVSNQFDVYPDLGYVLVVLGNSDASGTQEIARHVRSVLTAPSPSPDATN